MSTVSVAREVPPTLAIRSFLREVPSRVVGKRGERVKGPVVVVAFKDAEGLLSRNPTNGIEYKAGDFNGAFDTPEDTKKLLRYLAEQERDLIGYHAPLTFAGLRPSEGACVQSKSFRFGTNALHVRPGQTGARHCPLEPPKVGGSIRAPGPLHSRFNPWSRFAELG